MVVINKSTDDAYTLVKRSQVFFGASACAELWVPTKKKLIWFYHLLPYGYVYLTMICAYGGFLEWWYPENTPKWSFLVGKPMVVGYHHFRKHPYRNVRALLPVLQAFRYLGHSMRLPTGMEFSSQMILRFWIPAVIWAMKKTLVV